MDDIIVKINHLFKCSSMAPKPRTAVYKRMLTALEKLLEMGKCVRRILTKKWDTSKQCSLNLAMKSQTQRKANSANSSRRFICKPWTQAWRTLEMEEMAKVAKVLVQEQHSNLFTIQPVSIRWFLLLAKI